MRKTISFQPIVWFYILTLLPYMGISGISGAVNDTVYQGWQVISMIFLTLRLLMRARQIVPDRFSVCFVIFEVVVFASTTLNHGFSPGILTSMFAMALIVFLVQTDRAPIIRALVTVTVLAALINFGYMLFISGENVTYFIGGKNRLPMFLLPAIFFRMLYSVDTYGGVRKSDYLFAALCILSVMMGRSATGIMTAAAAVVAVIAAERWKIWIDKKLVLTAVVMVNLMLILAADFLFESQFWLELTASLGKNTTLTGRTEIWNLSMEMLRQSPLFGMGRGTEVTFINSYGEYRTVYEAHNFILEIFFQGGVIAFGFYAAGFLSAYSGLRTGEPQHRIVLLMLIVVLINGLAESVNNILFVILAVALANYYSNIENRKLSYG